MSARCTCGLRAMPIGVMAAIDAGIEHRANATCLPVAPSPITAWTSQADSVRVVADTVHVHLSALNVEVSLLPDEASEVARRLELGAMAIRAGVA